MSIWLRALVSLAVLFVVTTTAAQISTRISPETGSMIEASADDEAPGQTRDGRVSPFAGAAMLAILDDLEVALATATHTRVVFATARGLARADGHRSRLERPPTA